jgi:hypothetical protein
MELSMPVLEIAEFSLAPGLAEEAFLATRPAMMAGVGGRDGFVSLRLGREGDRWTDIVEWRDMAAAQAAGAALMEEPALRPFLAALDRSSVVMRHLEVVARS